MAETTRGGHEPDEEPGGRPDEKAVPDEAAAAPSRPASSGPPRRKKTASGAAAGGIGAGKKAAATGSTGGGSGRTRPASTATGGGSGPGKKAAAEAAGTAAVTTAGSAPEAGASTGVTRHLAPVGRALVSQRAPRIRAWIALFLVIVGVVAIIVSCVALWSRELVFNTDAYVKTVAPIADDPQVRHAVSVYVTDKAIAATDLNTRIENALPSDAKILATPLTSQLRGFLIGEIDKFLGTELARGIWIDINRFGHQQLIAALQDQNKFVTVGQQDVKLNLLPLVAVALQKLSVQIPRLLGKDVQLPQIDPNTAPAQIRTLLQDALGKPLPADFGSITVLRGGEGYQAKQALRQFKDLVVLAIVLTFALVVAALLVSPHKRRTALQLGLGALLAFVAVRVIEVQLEKAIAAAVKSPGGEAVARSIVSSAIDSLNRFFIWVAVAGAIVAVAAFLASRPAWLDAMGRGFAKLFGVASDLSAPDTGVGRWMAAHLDVLRIAGVGAAVVMLLVVAGSLSAVIVVVVALVVYELALTAYALGVPAGRAGEPPGAAT